MFTFDTTASYTMPAHFGARQLEPGSSGWYRTIRAALIAADGVADPHDLDRAWIAATSLRPGPFGLIDQLGVAGFAAMCDEQVAADLVADDEARAAIDFVDAHGDSFYNDPDPAYERPEFLRPGKGDQ